MFFFCFQINGFDRRGNFRIHKGEGTGYFTGNGCFHFNWDGFIRRYRSVAGGIHKSEITRNLKGRRFDFFRRLRREAKIIQRNSGFFR